MDGVSDREVILWTEYPGMGVEACRDWLGKSTQNSVSIEKNHINECFEKLSLSNLHSL